MFRAVPLQEHWFGHDFTTPFVKNISFTNVSGGFVAGLLVLTTFYHNFGGAGSGGVSFTRMPARVCTPDSLH